LTLIEKLIQTLPSEVTVDVLKVSCMNKIHMDHLEDVLTNVCLVPLLQKIIMPKNANYVTLTVKNVTDLPIMNVTSVLHGPLWLMVKKVCVLLNVHLDINKLVQTPLLLILNSVKKITMSKVVLI
jgi:hypothetical protein